MIEDLTAKRMHVCLPPLLQEAAPWKVNPLNPEGRLAHVIAHLRHTRIDSALLDDRAFPPSPRRACWRRSAVRPSRGLGGLGGLDRLLRIRRRSAIQPARWGNGSGHQTLRGGKGEPVPQAVSIPIAPTSRPSPSSRQSELSKAVKNTPGISSIWNSNANF